MMYQDSCTHVLPFLNPCMQKVHTMNLQLNAFMIWAFFNNYPSGIIPVDFYFKSNTTRKIDINFDINIEVL